jgi:hypothetical protein
VGLEDVDGELARDEAGDGGDDGVDLLLAEHLGRVSRARRRRRRVRSRAMVGKPATRLRRTSITGRLTGRLTGRVLVLGLRLVGGSG